MEFDVDKLCPTYRLFIGIPGKSNAFEISERLGIPERIIESAKEFLKGEDVKFEDIISSAQSQHRIAEEERALAQEARAELERLRAEAEQERKKLADERAKQQAKAREEARKVVADTKREMEKLIVQVRALKGIDRSAADRVIQQARDKMRAEESELAEPLALKKDDAGAPPKAVKPGDSVKIVSLDQRATVLSPADARGDVQVQAGILKLSVKLSDLRFVQEERPEQGKSKFSAAMDRRVGLELDIRGMLVDEALAVVDRYLDDAFLSGLSEVNIIHGKGTGALRTGVQNFLKRHPRVKGFRIGNYGEGDAGVTVVTLKK